VNGYVVGLPEIVLEIVVVLVNGNVVGLAEIDLVIDSDFVNVGDFE